MGLFKKLLKHIVYQLTDKPTEYVHVDKPKSLQDLRQIDYNNWCKAKGVYNGSYLPLDGDTLLKKGYIKLKKVKRGTKDPNESDTNPFNHKPVINERYERKSTGQRVEYHANVYNRNPDITYDTHYHWENRQINEDEIRLNLPKGAKFENAIKKVQRLDRYGKPCAKDSAESHLGVNDTDYVWQGYNKKTRQIDSIPLTALNFDYKDLTSDDVEKLIDDKYESLSNKDKKMFENEKEYLSFDVPSQPLSLLEQRDLIIKQLKEKENNKKR